MRRPVVGIRIVVRFTRLIRRSVPSGGDSLLLQGGDENRKQKYAPDNRPPPEVRAAKGEVNGAENGLKKERAQERSGDAALSAHKVCATDHCGRHRVELICGAGLRISLTAIPSIEHTG